MFPFISSNSALRVKVSCMVKHPWCSSTVPWSDMSYVGIEGHVLVLTGIEIEYFRSLYCLLVCVIKEGGHFTSHVSWAVCYWTRHKASGS